jgi:hypothetical protein
MVIQILAFAVFLFVLFSLFRFAMGLRWAKVSRESERASAEGEGRRVVAELPLASGEVTFLAEDPLAFSWGEIRVAKADVAGVRMRLNGGVLAEHARDGVRLPSPSPPEEYEGRERWDVALYGTEGLLASIPCGVLREGVSREVAATVFAAVKRGVAPPDR